MLDRMKELDRLAERRDAEESPQSPEPRTHDSEAADARLRTADAVLAAARAITAPVADTEVRTMLREGLGGLYEGDIDGAAHRLADAMAAARPDPAILAAQVTEAVAVQEGLQFFKGKYPEIVADVHLAGLADAYYAQARARGSTELEAFDAAGAATRVHLRRALDLPADSGTAQGAGDGDASGVIAAMAAERLSGLR